MDVIMPQLGETVTEGTVTVWCKKIGDKVKAAETLFEVSTDKVDTEIPAPAAGVLADILDQIAWKNDGGTRGNLFFNEQHHLGGTDAPTLFE